MTTVFYTHPTAGHFENVPVLDEMGFQSNQIATVEEDAFRNVPSVTKIDLSNNQIQVRVLGSFCMTPTFREYDL